LNALEHFTFRELLVNKAMAQRAVKRGRKKPENEFLILRIEAELNRRRELKWNRLHAELPPVPALDE